MDEGKVCKDGAPREVLIDETTRLVGVGIPKATLLHQMLSKEGMLLRDEIPLSSEEMVKQLLEALEPR
jgi:hypothetical protein